MTCRCWPLEVRHCKVWGWPIVSQFHRSLKIPSIQSSLRDEINSERSIPALNVQAGAPVKAFDQEGESPFQANVTSLNNKSNCVAARQGGEQLELNDQSVTK